MSSALYSLEGDFGFSLANAGASDPDDRFKNGADAALVQILGTGVIWKISPVKIVPRHRPCFGEGRVLRAAAHLPI